MPIRGAIPFTFRPWGVCDAVDGTNAPPGAMLSLKNLTPNPANAQQFVPRPAATQTTNFSGFSTPAKVNALLVIGTREYGMVASARNAGKDEPYCYDMVAGAFVTIGNVTSANSPTSPATSGDWTPPVMAMIANRIMITHPGYSGSNKVGWIDLRAFSDATKTGDTHTNTTVDNLSGNPITAGWTVGDLIAGAGIPASTYITALTATSVTLSQAATATAAGVALTVTSGTRAAPVYGAGNTNTNGLSAAPKSVGLFNGRAWYAVANGLQFSDSLKPCQITNATQALTLGDDQDVTMVAGMPLSNQVGGGVVQSLIAFKGAAPYWQITGDSATSDLKSDQVQGSVGTLGPLTVAGTPLGLAYVALDGLRIIDPLTGRCGDPIGANGIGITAPFIYAISPSRMCAAFNKGVYRVSVQNGLAPGQPVQEWWHHFSLGIWTGPHDFPAGVISRCDNGLADFCFAASGVNAKLFQHTISSSSSSTFTENGAAMSVAWTTTLLPDNQMGVSNQIVESAQGIALPSSQALTIQALDEAGNALGTLALNGDGMTSGIWNIMVWGSGTWGGVTQPFRQYRHDWAQPLVFKQMVVSVYGPANYGLILGNLYTNYQPTGYQGAFP